jgi:hypothetical protein
MSHRAQDSLFAATGVAFVVLELAGFGLGGPTHQLTVTSSAGKIAQTLGKPATTVSWVGAYLDLLSFGAFLAFAMWACATLGSGLLAQVGRAAASGYATLSMVSLAVMDTIAYRAGHGLSVSLARTLVTANEAIFVATWFLMAFFMWALGALSLGSAHRVLGGTAIAVALYTLLATAVSVNTLGQLSILPFFAWIIGAGITLGYGKRAPASALTPRRV